MQHVSQTKAQAYAPTTLAASSAAAAFIRAANEWSVQFQTARKDLAQLLRDKGVAARGYLASDPLSMSSFGLVFDGNPGAGFIAVPLAVAERLRERGLRGNAYFPDMNSALGREVMGRLTALSRVAEQRPLLNAVPGVSAVVIEDGRVVLSRAVAQGDGAVVLAAPSAVGPQAQVAPVAPAVAAARGETESAPVRARRAHP